MCLFLHLIKCVSLWGKQGPTTVEFAVNYVGNFVSVRSELQVMLFTGFGCLNMQCCSQHGTKSISVGHLR